MAFASAACDAGSEEHQSCASFDTAGSDLTPAELRFFRGQSVYGLGNEFEGRRLAQITTQGGTVELRYGNCDVPDLRIQTIRTCPTPPGVQVVPSLRHLALRGTRAEWREGMLVVYTGTYQVRVLAESDATILRAIDMLRGLGVRAAGIDHNDDLPPAIPQAERRVPCQAERIIPAGNTFKR